MPPIFKNLRKILKKMWCGVKEIINQQTNKTHNEINLNINGKLTSDKKAVADSFNQYFTTVAQKLIDKLRPTTDNFEKYLTSTNPHSFLIDPVTPEEVNDIIANLDKNIGNDYYDIPSKLIKMIRMISKPFVLIANSSFSQGIFPDRLKFAKVLPIHKGKCKSIFLLLTFSASFFKRSRVL